MLDSADRSVSTEASCDLLKLCLQCRWNPQTYTKAKTLLESSEINLVAFCDQVEHNNLAPLVYFVLSNQDWVPAGILTHLHQHYIDSAIQNTLLFRELSIILKAFEKNEINVVLLKGAALGSQIYPNIALRPMEDLDLLVFPEDTARAVDILRGLGYQEIRQEEQSGFTFRYENEIALQKSAVLPIRVEIHWNLFNSPYYQGKLSPEWLWSRSQAVSLDGTRASVLQPEIQFLHLCGHLSYHHPGQEVWLWYHDLAEMIMFYGDRLNWNDIFTFAEKNDLLLSLKANLRILLRIYGVIIPQSVIAMLERTTPSTSEQKHYPRLSAQNKTAGKIFLNDFTSLDGVTDKLHFAILNLFPSPHYMQDRYHIKSRLLLPFYYPYRWFRGIISLF